MSGAHKSASFMMELRLRPEQSGDVPATVIAMMLDHAGRARGVDTSGAGRLYSTNWRQEDVFAALTASDLAALETGGAIVVTGKALALYRPSRSDLHAVLVAFHGQHGDRWFADPISILAGVAPIKLAREMGAPHSPTAVPFSFAALIARAALGDFEPLKGKYGRKKRGKSLRIDDYFQMIQFGRVGLFPEITSHREIVITVCPYTIVDTHEPPFRTMRRDDSSRSSTVLVGYCDEYQRPSFCHQINAARLRMEVLKLDKIIEENAH